MELTARAAPTADAAMTQESFSDYRLYTLGRKTTINNNETKQVSMLTGTAVPIRKRYVVDGQASTTATSSIPARQSRTGCTSTTSSRTRRAQASVCQPAGVVRVYQADSKGSTQFVGEDRIGHTPKDESLHLEIGTAFDLTCERKQSDFEKIAPNVYEIE